MTKAKAAVEARIKQHIIDNKGVLPVSVGCTYAEFADMFLAGEVLVSLREGGPLYCLHGIELHFI